MRRGDGRNECVAARRGRVVPRQTDNLLTGERPWGFVAEAEAE